MIERPRTLRAVLLALGALATGCAAALREPRPIVELAGGAPSAGRAEAAELLLRAEALFAERDVDKAGAAAGLYLRAATADDAPIEALLGAVRADVWLTDHVSDPEARGRAAAAAVEASQWCARKAPADPACDYWLGAALGPWLFCISGRRDGRPGPAIRKSAWSTPARRSRGAPAIRRTSSPSPRRSAQAGTRRGAGRRTDARWPSPWRWRRKGIGTPRNGWPRRRKRSATVDSLA